MAPRPPAHTSDGANAFRLHSADSGRARLVVQGVLGRHTVDEFRTVGASAEGEPAVVVDLQHCAEIDNEGLGALIRTIRRIHDSGGHVVVALAPASHLVHRLRHVGINRLAPVLTVGAS